MKTVPPDMQAALDGRATTHCRCWRAQRRDGAVFGFTDHDRDLSFGGTVFEAASGFTATSIEGSLGLSVDNLDVAGALSSASITEDDIARGLWDDAEVEVWLVDWTDTSQRLLLRRGNIGEVSRRRQAFTAELRGLAHRLDQTYGRLFSRTCAWELGDPHCGVALPAWTAAGSVVQAYDFRRFTASGLGSFEDRLFRRGLLTWTSGANLGLKMEVKTHSKIGGTVTVELALPMPDMFTAGDAFTIQAGCDKTWETCQARFGNSDNFGGFPHMPGQEIVIGYASQHDLNDGGSLFR
jgi:uncharacterized phage protein (TIGR02218 family)